MSDTNTHSDPKAKRNIDDILAERIAKAKGRVSAPSGLKKRDDLSTSRCTPAQERFYFLQKSRPESFAYNMYTGFRIKGRLDFEGLRKSVENVVARHEALRSRIVESKEGRLSMTFDVELKDIYSEEKRKGLDQSHLVELASQVYDLNKGPLYRIRLASTLDELDHTLLIEAHHIVSDEASLSIICRDLFRQYDSPTEGSPSGSDFGDYAQSFLGKSESGDFESALNYWFETLKDLPEHRDLNLGKALAVNEMTGAMIKLSGSAQKSWTDVEQFASRLKTTPFVVCLTALHAFLYKINANQQNPIGVPFSNRDSSALENMPGLLLNTIVSSVEIDPKKSFEENVLLCRDRILQGMQHGQAAMDQVVKRLNPDRSRGGNPLFDVMLVQFQSPQIPELGGLEIEKIDIDLAASKFDLSFFIEEKNGLLEWSLEYSDSIYDRTTAELLLRRLNDYLKDSIAHSQENLASRSIESADRSVLSGSLLSKNGAFLDAFKEVAKSQAENTAVKCGDVDLSYADLNSRSNLVAANILKRYAGLFEDHSSFKGRPLGIMMDRSVEGVLLIIACLKARIPYLPLDPKYPLALIETLKAKAELSFVVGESDDAVKLSDLEDQTEDLVDWKTRLEIEDSADDIAYIIYTSGSTGTPKGVAISHSNLAASTQARIEYYADKVGAYLLLSSFAFDSSVAGIYWTLQSGGTFVLPEPGSETNAKYLLDTIQKEKISHTLCLPSLYEVLLRYDSSTQLSSLNTVIVAGEACPRSLLDLHNEKNPGSQMFNEYGPTEATVWASVEEIDLNSNYDRGVSIGKAIPGVELAVLDPDLQPASKGFPGQLAISGPTLSPGYWKSDRETYADKFTEIDAKRYYLTGDLVRLGDDGKLDFLGRLDKQAKVNGYRVELDSIKKTLEEIDSVDEAHLAILEGQLAAIVRSSSEMTQVELKQILAGQLPPYQIPGKILMCTEVPRLGNGKIDFASVGNLQGEFSERQEPQTEEEALLKEIWEDLLEVKDIGVNQNFFDLGGHSLLAIRLFAEIENRTGQRLALSSVIENPSISSLAKRLGLPTSSSETLKYVVPFGKSEKSAEQERKKKGSILCMHAGGGNVLFYEPLSRHFGDYEVFGIQAPPPEDKFPSSVEALCDLYLVEIRRHQITGPYTLIGRCFGTAVALVLANKLQSFGEQVESLIILDSQIPMASAKALGIPEKTLIGKSAAAMKLMSEGKWRMLGDEIYSRSLRISNRYFASKKNSESELENDYYQVAAANLTDALDNVLVQYKAKAFDGNVLLVKSSEYEKRKEYAVIEEEWRSLCAGEFSTKTIETSHRKIFTEPAVSDLGRLISHHLDTVSN